MIKVILDYQDKKDDQIFAAKDANPTGFYVYRNLLRKSSGFFQAATKPKWDAMRDDKHTVTVNFIEPEVFQSYVHWLYTHTIPCPCADKTGNQDAQDHLAQSYIAGEQLMDSKFKRAVMETYVSIGEVDYFYPSGNAVRIIYEGTQPKSPARRFIADIGAYESLRNCDKDSWKEALHQYPQEALMDVIKVIMVKAKSNDKEFEYWPSQTWKRYFEDVD